MEFCYPALGANSRDFDCTLIAKCWRLRSGMPPALRSLARDTTASFKGDNHMMISSCARRSVLLAGFFFGAFTIAATAQQPAAPSNSPASWAAPAAAMPAPPAAAPAAPAKTAEAAPALPPGSPLIGRPDSEGA